MPTCTTIIMYLFNPTISIIVDGVERVLPRPRIPAIRWLRSIIATVLKARHASNNGRCARISSSHLARGQLIKRHDREQSP